MPRYAIKMTAVTMVFEVDAPDELSAKAGLWNHFRTERGDDPLQGTRFGFDSTERACSRAQLMTTSTSLNDPSHLKLIEKIED